MLSRLPGSKQPPRKKAAPPLAVRRRLWFAPAEPVALPEPAKKPAEKKVRKKNDPKLVAAARELRDRWLEHVNNGGALIGSAGKYEVSRALPEAVAVSPAHLVTASRLLPAA